MMFKSIACLIILLNIAGVIVLASSAYDSIECDPNSNRARTGRAQLINSIPCDLSKQSYCNLPGNSYPWNAVKRFVYDNQGLVRRMYGDLRHIFVMQSELENEIDFDDIQHTADKYSKAFNNNHKQQQQQPRARQMKAKKVAAAAIVTTTKTTKRNVERKNYRSGDASEPHFRPAQRPSATNSKQRTKPPKVNVNDQSEKSSLIDNFIQTNVDALSNEKVTTTTTTLLTTSSTSSPIIITTTTAADSSVSTSEITINDESSSSSTKHIDDESDRTKTIDKAALDLFSNISSALSAASTTTTLKSTIVETPTTTTVTETSEKPTILVKNNLKNEEIVEDDDDESESEEEEILSELLNDSTIAASSSVSTTTAEKIDEKEQTSKDPSLTTTTTTTEAQLYQDHATPLQTMNRRGVNACEVKEEVVAPFWGNNTRGEILALLNVYPFEQYINWEKCTHEHEQMYCRKGCRCEQQYRLHRLLAYNPLDACRGIFSDWFRFPSCCICKCYDIPFDYRVTSRSPRGSNKVLDASENENDDVKVEDDDDDEEISLFDNDEIENYFDDS